MVKTVREGGEQKVEGDVEGWRSQKLRGRKVTLVGLNMALGEGARVGFPEHTPCVKRRGKSEDVDPNMTGNY
jgi:hypothetical protein